MSDKQYARPVYVKENQPTIKLERIPISAKGSNYDEKFIQKIAFDYPDCLPITEIDSTYEGLIPVCMELATEAGPLDILYVTPQGRLVIVETKLWRNPEARRKVVGQILEYAGAISHWSYSDLQREVSRKTKRKGNVLFDLVADKYPEIKESEFVDEVTRSLSRGDFLLIILGDGIREGVEGIAEYLEKVGGLAFTLGLVELAIYDFPDGGCLLQSRVMAKTTIIKRFVVQAKDGHEDKIIIDESPDEQEESQELNDQEKSQELNDQKKIYSQFWKVLLNELSFDDPSQCLPKSNSKQRVIFFSMPPYSDAWIAARFNPEEQKVEVFLRFTRGDRSNQIYNKLFAEQEIINKELGLDACWSSHEGQHTIMTYRSVPDLFAEQNQREIREFFCDSINRFVNVFRPRLIRITEDIS